MAAVKYTTTIHKFDKQGEKTGWTYIDIPADIAEQLKPGTKTSFRVKGKLDSHAIKGVALIPMGGGAFIMPLNADLRKLIAKRKGAMLEVQLQEDKEGFIFNAEFLECLDDAPEAKTFFETLSGAEQRYFSKWIDSAKTDITKAKRIAQSLDAFLKKWGYAQMIRANKKVQ
jgi:hypothetical protein